jgi:hypothetical protein
MKRAVVVTVLLLIGVAARGEQSVPNPTVTGPVAPLAAPGDPSHNYTFFSTNVDLASKGYVEQEFFFNGMANTYDINPSVPKSDNAVITSSGNPYKTRMVVRRPLSAKDFNGTILMEWQNVTAGYEPDALWIASHDHLIRKGYAWVGVSAQRKGLYAQVVGLRAWSPSRYGTLSIPNTAGPIMSDVDGLSWDIFSQAAQAVRHPQGTDAMGGLTVERIFAVGWSQSAVRLASYHNSIHPLAQVFDGFGLIGLDGQVLLPLRTDLNVKVFKVQPETNVAGNGNGISQALLDVQEPNSDHFRRWEVAGAAELGYHEAQEAAPLQARDLPSSPPPSCDLPPLSRVPWHFVVNASYDSLVRWVKNNEAPPIAPDIQVMTYGQVSVLLVDGYGNALGGIRLSQMAVPTATNTGENGPVQSMCRYLGSYVPFDSGTLNALYPDHQAYLNQVIEVTHQNQTGGFIDGADAAATITEAAKSDVGR